SQERVDLGQDPTPFSSQDKAHSMVQLWLYCEVAQFMKTLRGLQTQSALTPYLFPKLWAFCEHVAVIQQLATS
ncbi:hypothetical protein P7K49_026807, partial [Saguinus oedipus]